MMCRGEMHESSYKKMKAFADTLGAGPLKIADIGSMDVWGGTYRPIFSKPEWSYTGFDLSPGPNVDVVLSDERHWRNVASESFDIVVSGQTLEHCRWPWLFMEGIARICKHGGRVCVIAPFQWEYHPSPLDCWRIFPDGMRAVMEYVGLKVESVHMADFDTIGIAGKP